MWNCLGSAIGPVKLAAVSRGGPGFYPRLVHEAAESGILGPRGPLREKSVFEVYASEVFRLRNKVAHDGLEPTSADAEEIHTKARQVIEFVRAQKA